MMPIKASKIKVTSSYGPRTYTYQGKQVSDFHRGIDLRPADNIFTGKEEILAFADGEVTSIQKTGKQYGTGCYVRIKHSNGLYTLYYHLKSGSICVKKGDKVKAGQKIGIIGTTGQSTGIHLHFQIDKGTSATSINPADYVLHGKELVPSSTNPSTPTKTTTIKAGDTVIVNGRGTARADGKGSCTKEYKNQKMRVIAIHSGVYACNQYNEGKVGDYTKVTAWFKASTVKKV